MDQRWPRLLGPPPASGRLRVQPEDFQVEEIPAYLPSGRGAHLLIEVEKTNLTSDQVLRMLARELEIRPADVGCAGMKDRRAITRQWFSLPADRAGRLSSLDHPGVVIVRSGLHGNKLKTGHLKGNRFRIVVRDIPARYRADIEQRIEVLARRGAPNYFGRQRFGRCGANEAEGRAILRGRGRRHDRRTLRLLLSAVQSAMFNDVLALRIEQDLFQAVLQGDVLHKTDTGGRFLCADPQADQPRADRFEIHPTGPMFGPKMPVPAGKPAQTEQQVLEASGLSHADFARFAKLTRGTRRDLRLAPLAIHAEWHDDAALLSFQLPAGGYATAVLRELVDATDEGKSSE